MLAPARPLIVELTPTPAAATKPEPLFFCTVTVKVCAFPTLFTPVWAIVMRASTHVFWLATLNAPYPKVEAVMLTPLIVTNAFANTVEVPTADEFTVSVHCPLAFVGPVAGAPQVPPVIDPGPDSDVK